MIYHWTRPDNLPYPRTWKTFNGKIIENGRYNRYRIQDLTGDMIDDALEHLVKFFLIKEAITSSIGIIEEQTSLEECCVMWREALAQRMSLVAVVENEGTSEKGKPRIAGLNVLYTVHRKDKDHGEKIEGKRMSTLYYALDRVDKGGDIFGRYNDVDCYLKGLGLSVTPSCQKDNVGYELLLVREDMCRAMNIPMTGTVFTGPASQYLAKKAGFDTVVHYKYGDFVVDGEFLFPRITEQSVKYMEKVYK